MSTGWAEFGVPKSPSAKALKLSVVRWVFVWRNYMEQKCQILVRIISRKRHQVTHLVVGVIIFLGQHIGIVPLIQLGCSPQVVVSLGGQELLHVASDAAIPFPHLKGNQIRLAQRILIRLGPQNLVVLNDEIAKLKTIWHKKVYKLSDLFIILSVIFNRY